VDILERWLIVVIEMANVVEGLQEDVVQW